MSGRRLSIGPFLANHDPAVMRTAVTLWVSLMDNGLFELPAASASPPRDAGVDHSRRDRDDEEFAALVRESDAKLDESDANTTATPDHQSSGEDRGGDAFAPTDTPDSDTDTAARPTNDQPDHSASEPKQSDGTPAAHPGADGEPPASEEAPEASTMPVANDSAKSSSLAAAAAPHGALEALISNQPNPVPAPAVRGNAGSTESAPRTTAPASGVVTPAGVAPPPSPGQSDPAGPTVPGTAATPDTVAATPTESATPSSTQPQSQPGETAETFAPATEPVADTTSSQATDPSTIANDVEAVSDEVQTPVPKETSSPAAAEAPDAIAGGQAAGTETRQPSEDPSAATLANTMATAAAANAAATGRATPTAQAPANGQSRPGASSMATTTPSGLTAQGANAASTNQASAAPEMALAAAAEQAVPSSTSRAGDAAPDLAVFRETLATVLPDAGGTQATDSMRTAGRIVAAELSARPPIPNLSLTDQVSIRIREAFAAGDSEVRIQLHPKELGRIDVRMEISESGRMSAHVVAERADTLELLIRDSRGLERALQQAGFETDSNSLAFDLKGQGEQTADGESGGDGIGAETAQSDTTDPDEINIDLAALMNGDASTSGVDIRV